jgi:hypothetical protein
VEWTTVQNVIVKTIQIQKINDENIIGNSVLKNDNFVFDFHAEEFFKTAAQ